LLKTSGVDFPRYYPNVTITIFLHAAWSAHKTATHAHALYIHDVN